METEQNELYSPAAPAVKEDVVPEWSRLDPASVIVGIALGLVIALLMILAIVPPHQ